MSIVKIVHGYGWIDGCLKHTDWLCLFLSLFCSLSLSFFFLFLSLALTHSHSLGLPQPEWIVSLTYLHVLIFLSLILRPLYYVLYDCLNNRRLLTPLIHIHTPVPLVMIIIVVIIIVIVDACRYRRPFFLAVAHFKNLRLFKGERHLDRYSSRVESSVRHLKVISW